MGPIKTNKQIYQQKFLETEAKLIRFAGGKQMERWYAYGEDSCPICDKLASLGWVEFGLLPPFKKAHSIIGEGKWKCSDANCQCAKGYKRVAGEQAKNIIPISGYNGPNSIKRPKLKFTDDTEVELKYTTEEVKQILQEMKHEFGSCNCKH